MKKIILGLTLLSTVSAFGYTVNLEQNAEPQVLSDLLRSGATRVTWEPTPPKCILVGSKLGIQYPDQGLPHVKLTRTTDYEEAISQVIQLKEAGLCK